LSRDPAIAGQPAPERPGSGDHGIIGREDELARLIGFLRADDGPMALVLEGAAGIGKTTLWTAAVEAAGDAGHRVLSCRPAGAEVELSYGALGDLIGPVFDEILVALPPPQRWALEVALLLREPEGPPPDQRAVGLGLSCGLGAISRDAPTLVAIDDAQWVDAASARVLEFALRRLEGIQVKVLAAVRAAEHRTAPLRLDRGLGPDRIDRLTVGPLSLGALHRMLRIRLGVALPRPSLVRVYEASAGNPFYALELGRALLGHERRPAAGRPLSMTETLDDLLLARLTRLPRPVRSLIGAAGAMADPTLSVLAQVMGISRARLLSSLDVAVDAGIVVLDSDRVRFTHPLLASSGYWQASEAERRRVHRRLARSSASVEERARHLALAAAGPDEKVARTLDAASRQAAVRGAAVTAAELAELAAGATPSSRPAVLRRRRMQLAERCIEAGDWARARRILEEVISGVSRGGARADVLYLLAETHGDDKHGQRNLLHAALTEAGDSPERLARIHRRLAETAGIGLDQRAGLAHARAAVQAAERVGDTGMLASSLAYVGLFETFMGDVTPGVLERAIALEERASYLRAYESPIMVMGYRLLIEDRFDEARVWLERADARAGAHDDFASRMTIALHLAELEIAAGGWERALEHAAEGYALADELDSDHSRSAFLYVTARAKALLGRLDAARADAQQGVALARSSSADVYNLHNRRVLGFVALSAEDWATAVSWLAPLLESESVHARRFGYHAFLPDVIEALVNLGRVEQAAEEAAQQLDRPFLLACAARCRGMVQAHQGDADSALATLAQAMVDHDRLPNPFERGRTLLARGRIERRHRRRRAARQSLLAALATFADLGATAWAEQARRELGRIGGRAPSIDALTPTEEQVAVLVAEGRTNREAAEVLYLSEHTVEGHLSRIYAKLGVRSRGQLTRRLAERAQQAPAG
jgi:DNA-binding CsgD family transcriptional regulator